MSYRRLRGLYINCYTKYGINYSFVVMITLQSEVFLYVKNTVVYYYYYLLEEKNTPVLTTSRLLPLFPINTPR